MNRFFLLFILASGCFHSSSQEPDYSVYTALLKKAVTTTGKVNYKTLKESIKDLDQVIQSLSTVDQSRLTTRTSQMAYWINVYNVHTLKLIVQQYPIKSIMDLDGGKTWDVPRIKIGDRIYSLNQIENDCIRKQYKDARIHFALNCSARSCPPLLNEAYLPDQLDRQLDKQTKLFIDQETKVEKSTVRLSKLFDWYKGDFGSLVEFINKYKTAKIPGDSSFQFTSYDWSLND